jgi:HD superfamily phosphohydrolase
MYENVYHHQTTRGFEKILQALWHRARTLHNDNVDIKLLDAIRLFWEDENPGIDKYLALEEFTVLGQMEIWKNHPDTSLSELSRRFLERDRLVPVSVPIPDEMRESLSEENELAMQLSTWNDELIALTKEEGYERPEDFVLCDTPKEKLYKTIIGEHGPYVPEKESELQSPENAIRILPNGSEEPIEISMMLKRLQTVTKKPEIQIRYYVPPELRRKANEVLKKR